jgi:hypothetical protein
MLKQKDKKITIEPDSTQLNQALAIGLTACLRRSAATFGPRAGRSGERTMMTRYYFHVRSADDTVLDEEGDELPDVEAAHRQALASARELLGNAIKVGRDPVPDSIVIADASGREVMIVLLQDVLPSCFRKSREP